MVVTQDTLSSTALASPLTPVLVGDSQKDQPRKTMKLTQAHRATTRGRCARRRVPFAHRQLLQYQDPRFSRFVFRSDERATVRRSNRLREPTLAEHGGGSGVHLTIAYSSQTGFLPDKDPEFWLTAVATVPDGDHQLLAKGEATNTLLPGIYPHLRVRTQECKFTTIDGRRIRG